VKIVPFGVLILTTSALVWWGCLLTWMLSHWTTVVITGILYMVFTKQSGGGGFGGSGARSLGFGASRCPRCCQPVGSKRVATEDGFEPVNNHVCAFAGNGDGGKTGIEAGCNCGTGCGVGGDCMCRVKLCEPVGSGSAGVQMEPTLGGCFEECFGNADRVGMQETRWTQWPVADGDDSASGNANGCDGSRVWHGMPFGRSDYNVRERAISELGSAIDVSFNFDQSTGTECWNCHRCNESEHDGLHFSGDVYYDFCLNMYPTGVISTRGKFSTMNAQDLRDIRCVPLCRECASVVVFREKPSDMNAWPAFIWKMLTNEKLQAHHGRLLWGFVPMLWRHWWLTPARGIVTRDAEFGSVTMEEPRAYFREITKDRDGLMGSIKRLRFGELKCCVNKFMHSTVRCPWGCTEFPHKLGKVDLSDVYRHYLGTSLAVWSSGDKDRVKGTRDDCVSYQFRLFHNPAWEVMPGISFVPGYGPAVMTCRDHNDGSIFDYIHPPISPNGVYPAARADQIAHAIVVPRTISPMREKKFSNTFQMHQMVGSFQGIDTMSLVDRGNFDFKSLLTKKNELLSIVGRMDIRGLLRRYARDGVMPEWLVDYYLESAAGTSLFTSQQNAGATYVPYSDCIRLQKCLEERNDSMVVTDHLPLAEQRQVFYDPSWPSELVRVHRPDGYGGDMYPIPGFTIGVDARCLWFLFASILGVPSLYQRVVESVRGTKEWPGWVLSKIASKCMYAKRIRSNRLNPFPVLSMQRLHEKVVGDGSNIYCAQKMNEVLACVNGVSVYGIADLEREEDFGSNEETIIFTRSNSDGWVPLPGEVAGEYELVFVGESTSGGSVSTWNGQYYVRHGSPSFPLWWRQARRDVAPSKHGANLPESIGNSWDVAVYVKRCGSQLRRDMKMDYLQYIGGQVHNYCKVHDVPLIPAGQNRSRGRMCCCAHDCENESRRCRRVPYQECAVSGCSVVVCRSHSKETLEKRYHHPWSTGNVPDDEDNDNLDAHVVMDGVENVIDGDVVVDMGDVVVDNADDVSVEHSPMWDIASVDSSQDGADSSPVQYENDDYVFDSLEVDDARERGGVGGEIAFGPGDYHIPGTNAGRKPIPIWCAKSYISGHVVLNNCGTCLIRRKRPLRPSRYQAAFLERIVATSDGYSVPLVYPEAMMFPSIFYKDTTDGSLLGGIPSCLLADDNVCRRNGFATVSEHTRARLKNPSLLCSTDPRYIFHAFDCFTNLNLRGEDSRLVLSRGFVEKQGTGGVTANRSQMFNTDSVDSRPVVNRLAAALGEEQATYFYTQTCNQSEFFGVSPIKRWIDSLEFEREVENSYGNLTADEKEEVLKAAKQAACVSMVRNWMEVSEIYMHYLAKSPERPLGKVKKIWWRHEYQDSSGNLSHIHCLIWTEDDDEQVILSRIRGSVADLFRMDDVETLLERGVIDRAEDIYKLRDSARSIQFHTCNKRCLRRTGPGPDDFQCRVPSTMMESPCPTKHCFKTVEPRHCQAALDVLKELGVCEDTSTVDCFVPVDNKFKSEKHFAPAMPGEGVMSPTSGLIFAMTGSQSNLQRSTTYHSSRYLAKYVAGVDENNIVYVNAGTEFSHEAKQKGKRDDSYFRNKRTGESARLVMDSHFLHNTKIKSSKINEQVAHKKMRDRNYPTGRAISITECVALLLGYSQVYTNLEFVNIPTVTLEKRPGCEREKPIKKIDRNARDRNDVSPGLITSYRVRERHVPRLPSWRLLTDSEQVLLVDSLFSPVSLDRTTMFGARPPELRFVKKQGLYFRWFKRSVGETHDGAAEYYASNFSASIEETTWIDGLHGVLKLRPEAFFEVKAYIQNRGREVPRAMSRLFATMDQYLQAPPTVEREQIRWEKIKERFFCPPSMDGLLPIPVYSNIKPSHPETFLFHVLLSMGEFDNEIQLFGRRDIRDVFVCAKLLDTGDVQGSIKRVLHQYVTEQLVYMPGGTRMFDRLCVEASIVLRQVLVTGEIPINEMPPALYTSLQTKTTDRVAGFLKTSRETLAKVTVERVRSSDAVHESIPDAIAFSNATKSEPLLHRMDMQKGSRQCNDSFEEQRRGFCMASGLLDQYLSYGLLSVKCLCIVGGPGCGKTFLMSLIQLSAMARGLNVMTTALMSERAQLLGGIHLHKVFNLPVREGTTVQRLAELALHSIYGNPELTALLLTLDVLFVDELGQMSSGTMACLDIILRRLRDSSQFFGGVVVICTMDPKQLRPIHGLPVMLSPSMLTSFKFFRLRYSVRAGSDEDLQRIQTISRMPPNQVNPEVETEFRSLVRSKCTFVASFDDDKITSTMLRVFGTHDAVHAAEKCFLDKVRSSCSAFVECKCEDHQMSSGSHSTWVEASEATSRALTKKVKDPDIVYFFPGAVYEMTHNNKSVGYSQSQISVLAEMPSRQQVDAHGDVALYIAPVGCKIIPEDVDIVSCPSQLADHGWKLCQVGLAPERIVSLWRGIKAKRDQYCFKQRIASTVHAVMGNDVLQLVTKVSLTDKWYRLWDKEQIVVLLSRTSYARDIIFVGDPDDTINALVKLIKTRTQYAEYISHVLDMLCGERDTDSLIPAIITIRQQFHPFRPADVGIPQELSGYCYILLSLEDGYTTYIGETNDLLTRLRQHNSGWGSLQTASTQLRPWALLSYVCGFDGSKVHMQRFEREWQQKRDFNFRVRRRLCPSQIADLARSVMGEWAVHDHLSHLDLRYMQTGTFQMYDEEGQRMFN